MDRIGVKVRRRSCAARLQEEGRQAVSMIRKAAGMKITVEDIKRGNNTPRRYRLKTVSQRRRVDETKSF